MPPTYRRPFMRRLTAVVGGVILAGAAACGSTGSSGAMPTSPSSASVHSTCGVVQSSPGSKVVAPSHVRIHWHSVVTGLSSPISVTNAGDRSGRLFINEQGGVIRIVRSGHLLSSPYLDISGEVASGGEQ